MKKKINVKRIAQTIEHVALIALLAGAVGFYFGNSYGQSQANLKSVKTATIQPGK